jgi:phosphate starvation-inducible protein PhoH and related proteins
MTPPASSAPKSAGDAVQMQFDDNALLPLLFGERDAYLDRIERQLGVSVVSRGNRLAISGPSPRADQARAALTALYDRLKRGLEVDGPTVDAAVRLAHSRPGEAPSPFGHEAEIHTRKRRISARGANQAEYIRSLREHELVFGLGPAGTGKTYLAVATAVDMMMSGKVERIVLSRPAVEAGERLGFLPGDLREKVDPYLRPLYDMLPGEQVQKRLLSGEIEIAPLAFMRGRTLSHAYIILDEAQNTTPVQMKMFLTRLGEGARMAVTGDLSQIDLPRGTTSGVTDALAALEGVDGVATIRFTEADVVRHPLVQRIVQAYERRDRKRITRRGASNHE